MNKREAAVISAYTGILLGEFSDLHKYVEEVFGRPVFTHQFPSLETELKTLSHDEFMEINENLTEF